VAVPILKRKCKIHRDMDDAFENPQSHIPTRHSDAEGDEGHSSDGEEVAMDWARAV
jgi:hypothetical protein